MQADVSSLRNLRYNTVPVGTDYQEFTLQGIPDSPRSASIRPQFAKFSMSSLYAGSQSYGPTPSPSISFSMYCSKLVHDFITNRCMSVKLVVRTTLNA